MAVEQSPSSSSPPVRKPRSKKKNNNSSEKTPLIAKAPERGSQEYGATLPELPIWQNQPMWSTGLFDCCADVPMCCFTMFLPCFAFGRNAEALNGGKSNSCWTAAAVWWALQHTLALGCLYSASYRGKLREKYNIPEGPVPDSVVHCLCWPCAFCQEHRELHYRSFGPESWGTNHQSTLTKAPSKQEFMSRPGSLGK